MRFPILVLAAAGAALMTGCSSLVSLNPFVSDEESVISPALAGVWKTGEDDGLVVIRQSGTHYTILYTENSSTTLKFEGRLFRAGDAELLDLVPSSDDGFSIPVHTVVRVWPGQSELRWAFLESDWLKQQAVRQLASQPAGDRTLLTAPGAVVHSLLAKYGADEKAYSKQKVMQREAGF